MITKDFLTTLFPKSRVVEYWPLFEANFEKYGITTANRIAFFLANAGHECEGFKTFVERMNYSAVGLAGTWPNRYSLWEMRTNNKTGKKEKKYTGQPNETAVRIQRKPEIIANLTYANRMGNGPYESGDGWRYRGRGIFMNTGESQYRIVSNRLSLGDLLLEKPDLMAEPEYAAPAAFFYWSDNNLTRFADTNNLKGCRIAIQGGTLHLDKVTTLYNKIIKIL